VDPDCQSLMAGSEQELASPGGLQPGTLSLAEMKRVLQLPSLNGSLGAEEVQRRVGGDD